MIGGILKHSALYTVANHLPMVANILLLRFVTKHLTDFDYGIYGLILGYMGALLALGDLGFIVLFQNSYFKEKGTYKKTWGKLFGVLIPWNIIYGAMLGLILWLVFHDDIPTADLPLVIGLTILPPMFLNTTKSIGIRWCQYEEKHKLVYRITMITGLLIIGINVFCIIILGLGYKSWIISTFVATLVQFLYFGYILYGKEKMRPDFRIGWTFLKDSLKISLPIIPHGYSNYLLTSSDRMIMDWYPQVSIGQIGRYNIAYSLSNYLSSFNDAVNTVLSPIYFRLFAKDDPNAKYVVKNLTFIWLFGLLVVQMLMCLWIKEFVHFFYQNETLHGAYKYAIFLVMGLSFRPLYNASVDRAIFHGKTMAIQQISVVSGVLNVLLNLALVPLWGVEAAVFSTFMCYHYKGVAGYFLPAVRKYIELQYYPLHIFVGTTLIAIGLYHAVEFDWLIKIPISLAILGTAAAAYWFRGRALIETIKSARKE